jgi:hypothetical protein
MADDDGTLSIEAMSSSPFENGLPVSRLGRYVR